MVRVVRVETVVVIGMVMVMSEVGALTYLHHRFQESTRRGSAQSKSDPSSCRLPASRNDT